MNLPSFLKRDDKTPRWGRASPIDVEVTDTVGEWYYFGKVEMIEKEFEFAKPKSDSKTFTCKTCDKPYVLPIGSEHCPKCGHGITAPEEMPAPPEKRKLYFYRLLTNAVENEKVIVADDDYIQNANQIPYTRTTRGRNRMFQVIMIAFGMVYALTLYLMALFVTAGPSIIYYTQQVNNLEWDVGNVAFIFIFGAVIWAWAARYHHFVSDWEVQPLRVNSLRVPVDFYILTNSSKVPVFEKVLQLVRLDEPQIDKMVSAVRETVVQEVNRLQTEVGVLWEQLDETHAEAFQSWREGREARWVGRDRRTFVRQDVQRWLTITAIVAVLSVIVTIAALGGI